jgi:hypothetical protein
MTNSTAISRLRAPMKDDIEALSVNKTVDSLASQSNLKYDKRDVVKKLLKNRLLVPTIVVFALIGVVNVSRDVKSYSQNERFTQQNIDSAVEDPALLTKNRNYNTFDGHIMKGLTNTVSPFKKLFSSANEMNINKIMENIADADSYRDTDVPFYWEVGGTGDLSSRLCECFPINMASSLGSDVGNPEEGNRLEHLETGGKCELYNVNLGTEFGLARANKFGLIENEFPDFISSPFLPEVASLFTNEKKGRLIIAVPNTMARLKMSYDYLRKKEPYEGTFLEFVKSNHVLANNYLTHSLSGNWEGIGELTEEDFVTAQKILKEKFTVARWADQRKIVDYLVKNGQDKWSKDGYDCMYPPENDYSKESAVAAQNRDMPPIPKKTSEEIEIENAVQLRNKWDEQMFDTINQQGAVQLKAFS